MLSRTAAVLAFAALPALALDTPQWPPPEGVETRMRELQHVIIARESTPAQRDAAREELVGLMKSPAARQRDPSTDRPAPRAAILDPAATRLVPLTPLAPAPGSVAHVEVIQPPKVVVVPQGGAIVQPSARIAIDGRTGRVLYESGGGFVDPQTGKLVPR